MADQFHFYASSVAEWMTTTPDLDLRKLLKLMDKDGYPYNLYFIPLPHDAAYQIKGYEPDIPDAIFLGTYVPK